MIRTVVLVAAALFAAPLVAQEEAYIYVSYKDSTGASVRHKLNCLDAQCKVDVNKEERHFRLSTAQRKALLDALQAEAKQFVVAADSASSGKLMKVKLRYDTPRKRLSIERRLPDDKPAGLTPEMLQVIKTHLALDLSKPAVPKSAADDEPSAEPNPQGQAK